MTFIKAITAPFHLFATAYMQAIWRNPYLPTRRQVLWRRLWVHAALIFPLSAVALLVVATMAGESATVVVVTWANLTLATFLWLSFPLTLANDDARHRYHDAVSRALDDAIKDAERIAYLNIQQRNEQRKEQKSE